MKKLNKLKKLAIIPLLLLPVIVSAQVLVPDVGLPGSPDADAGGLIQSIVMDLLLPFAGIIAVLFMIIGGFQYILSGANEDLAKRGKTTLQHAVLGLIIVILSYVIITVVSNTLLNLNSIR